MKKILTIALLLSTTSCVALQSDIAELKQNQAEYEMAVASDLRDLERGIITKEEFDRRQAELEEERQEGVAEVEQRIKDRTEAALAAATPTPITGNPLLDMVLGLGGTALAAGVGVNRYRDNKRRERDEPVTLKDVQKKTS